MQIKSASFDSKPLFPSIFQKARGPLQPSGMWLYTGFFLFGSDHTVDSRKPLHRNRGTVTQLKMHATKWPMFWSFTKLIVVKKAAWTFYPSYISVYQDSHWVNWTFAKAKGRSEIMSDDATTKQSLLKIINLEKIYDILLPSKLRVKNYSWPSSKWHQVHLPALPVGFGQLETCTRVTEAQLNIILLDD